MKEHLQQVTVTAAICVLAIAAYTTVKDGTRAQADWFHAQRRCPKLPQSITITVELVSAFKLFRLQTQEFFMRFDYVVITAAPRVRRSRGAMRIV